MSLCLSVQGHFVLATGFRRTAGRAAVALSLSLISWGACGDGVIAGDIQPATAVTALLSSARTTDSDFLVNVGFRLTQNTIQLEAQAAGAKAPDTFVLDSGAPMTVSDQLVDELGILPAASIELRGPEDGQQTVPVVSLPDVALAGLSFRDVGAVVSWVEPPSALACLSTAGLMGASLMQAAIWQIDFRSGQIAISSSLAGLKGLSDAMRLPFKRADAAGSPRILVGVADNDNASLLIDLGFNGSIAIPAAQLAESGDHIPDSALIEDGSSSTTVFGSVASTARIGRLRELRLGDLVLHDFPVATGTAVSDFHVGIEFLRHFRVTIDWRSDDLYLELRDPAPALYADFPSYGFAPQMQDGALVVGALWRDSAGARAGLALGDRLVEVDGQDTSAPDFATYCKVLNAVALYGSRHAPISVTRLREGIRETFVIDRTPLLSAPFGISD